MDKLERSVDRRCEHIRRLVIVFMTRYYFKSYVFVVPFDKLIQPLLLLKAQHGLLFHRNFKLKSRL